MLIRIKERWNGTQKIDILLKILCLKSRVGKKLSRVTKKAIKTILHTPENLRGGGGVLVENTVFGKTPYSEKRVEIRAYAETLQYRWWYLFVQLINVLCGLPKWFSPFHKLLIQVKLLKFSNRKHGVQCKICFLNIFFFGLSPHQNMIITRKNINFELELTKNE